MISYADARAKLMQWVRDCYSRGAHPPIDPEKYIVKETGSEEDRQLVVAVFTYENQYSVHLRWSPERAYLGGYSSSRRTRPGESWHRGCDLADGDFSEAKLQEILMGIVSCETVPIDTRSGQIESDAAPSVETSKDVPTTPVVPA